jgi:hypothetical protein
VNIAKRNLMQIGAKENSVVILVKINLKLVNLHGTKG